MARIKSANEATKDEALKSQEETAEAQNAEVQNANEATKDEADAESDGKAVTNEADIPDAVKKILKVFANYAELAIDAHGGVYTDIKKAPAKEKAVLYKNPYFK